MKTLSALAALAVLVSAGPALACLPPLPVTESERAEALWERQDLAWTQAATIAEVEVGRVDYLTPGERDPGSMRQVHVELRPVRSLRGDVPAAPVVLVYQDICGRGPAFSLAEGTRLLAYSRSAAIAAPGDVFELIPETEIVHEATVTALSAG